MIDKTLAVSKRIDNGRTVKDVLCSVQEEVGELAKEVRIKYGQSYKTPDKDGVFGESVDAIASLIDLIYVDNPKITKEEILRYLDFKLSKWELMESKHKLGLSDDVQDT